MRSEIGNPPARSSTPYTVAVDPGRSGTRRFPSPHSRFALATGSPAVLHSRRGFPGRAKLPSRPKVLPTTFGERHRAAERVGN